MTSPKISRRRLDEASALTLEYEDHSELGGAASGRADDLVRSLCSDIVALFGRRPMAEIVRRSSALLAEADRRGLSALRQDDGHLHPKFLYPDPRASRPAALLVGRGEAPPVRIPLAPELIGELASWLGDWQSPSLPPQPGAAARLFSALGEAGALVDTPLPEPVPLGPVTFVGHATVRFQRGDHHILVDPFFLPGEEGDVYRPLTPAHLGRPSGIFITHSHPDHFDLGTLLRFGRDVPIWVPTVERENVLTLHMADRLREVGFRSVHTLDWWSSVQVGPFRVFALPFFGEQPTNREVLSPKVRNHGNTYFVDDSERRFALTVDSGRDDRGDLVGLAREVRRRLGAPEVVFGGYRAFAKYPVHYLFSSVARYLPFVPREFWAVRQKIMGDADDLLDAAEMFGATRVVPYADGGAPWYWRRGLGPRLDTLEASLRNVKIDPPPECVEAAASTRSGSAMDGEIATPVKVHVLRPGDSLELAGRNVRRMRTRPFAWPFGQLFRHPEHEAGADACRSGREDVRVGSENSSARAVDGEPRAGTSPA